jgi:beta-phosphoglucomutase
VVLRALNLDRDLDVIVSAEDVTAGKPDPQVFLTAAARLGVRPAQSIVVEDAAAGIEAARRADMRCIGVNPRSVLDADVFVRSLEDLPTDAFDRLLIASARR